MSDLTSNIAKLNSAQKEAVDEIYGPIQVVAGPGTGKTQLLALRAANILEKTDANPKNILCLTYTEAGTRAMRERLIELIGEDGYKIPVFTFHGFGRDIINRFSDYFYGGGAYKPADELFLITILEKIFSKLDHNNTLSSKKEDSYANLKNSLDFISRLKHNGLTPEEFKNKIDKNIADIEKLNAICADFPTHRIVKDQAIKDFGQLLQAVDSLKSSDDSDNNLIDMFKNSLSLALVEANDHPKVTPPLTAWKSKWLVYSENLPKHYELKESKKHRKLADLAEVYESYQKELKKSGYFDFDDMVIDVVNAIKQRQDLKFELAENYQFIMVDEFQDTNMAQMQIIDQILSALPDDSQPNIMVVGDDDQGIYRFQGAELSNIINFNKRYNAKLITLTENYRSGEHILKLARQVIQKGENRLENSLKSLDKSLSSQAKNGQGNITRTKYNNSPQERSAVADDIRSLIDSGVDPKEIAVLAPRHAQLQAILPFLLSKNISVDYQTSSNVFNNQQVLQLLQMIELLVSLSNNQLNTANHLLSEVLRYEFWQIDSLDIWKLSRSAYENHNLWFDAASQSESEGIKFVVNLFIQLSIQLQSLSFEQVFDQIVGNQPVIVGEDKLYSPFKQYYFSRDNLKQNAAEYIKTLSAIRIIRDTVRQHFSELTPTTEQVSELMKSMLLYDVKLLDNTSFASSEDSIYLMTAYGSKGLEFEHVFIIEATDSKWVKPKAANSSLSSPVNMPIDRPKDDIDDWLRLFYVAMTRTKKHLHFSYSGYDDKNKSNLPLQFIENIKEKTADFIDEKQVDASVDEPIEDQLETEVFDYRHAPKTADEKSILGSIVKDMKLNVTALNNYLNLSYHGPEEFLYNNILHFPSAISGSAAFGNAMHASLSELIRNNDKDGNLETDRIKKLFKKMLLKEYLPPLLFDNILKKGDQYLVDFIAQNTDFMAQKMSTELNFSTQGVVLNSVPLSGNIDVFIPGDKKQALVIDFKTGKSHAEWDNTVRLSEYKRQLVFYKILVERSRNYSDWNVDVGQIMFLEPNSKQKFDTLTHEITKEDVGHLELLISAVWEKIQNLDFEKPKDFNNSESGTKRFEESLIENYVKSH